MASNLDNLISTLYDDEEDKDTQNELSPLTATLKSPSLEDIETSRKLAYGARQEPMILGNVWRLGKAGIQSAISDETFQEASQRIEEERQEEIIEDFPEFEGLEEYEEDAAIFTGRMGSALADPATFLLPWTKVAKAGKLATVGVGAGVATTDIALREQALYGEISPVTVGLAAVLGGGSSYLGDVVARQFGRGTSQGIKLSSKDLKALEDATPDTLVKPYVKEAPMVQQEIANNGKVIKEANDLILLKESVDHVRKVIKGTRYIKKEKAASKLEKELEALKLKPAILPRAERKRTLTLDQIEKLRSSAARKTAKAKLYSLAEIRDALSKKTQRVTKKQTELDEKLEELRKPLEELEVLYRRAGVSNYDELKDVTKAARKSHSEAFPKLLKQIEPEVEAGIAPIEELSKKGNLSARLLRKLVYEGTRPLFGGLLGFGLGTAFGDDDDEVMLYTLTFAGAGLGYWQKRIQRSTVLPKAHKKIADQVIQKQLKLNLNAWLKINTAASTAARMSAWGRELDVASKLTYKQQGATLNGKAVVSVEERSMLSLQENSRKIYEEVLPFIDDEMALTVGKLQNQFITEGEVLSKFGRKEAEKIFLYRDNVQAFTDQIADSVDEVGIKWNRLDKDHVYGLTQMWDWDAIHKAPELFREKLYKAIAKQNGLDPIEDLTRVEKLGDEFVASLAGVNKKSIFDKNNNVTIPLTKNFEKKRMLVDQDSRIIMQDFLINDPRLTLQQLIMNTSDSVEFARTFGAKGEYLRSIRRQVHEKYNKIDPKGLTTARLKKKELQQLNDSMDGFFGLYQVDKKMGDTGQNIAAGLTTLANTTMLTRVAIPSLGDLIQPLQNSGVHATIKAYGKQFRKSKGKTFAQQGLGIKYLSQMEHELRALSFGVDPNNLWQRKLSNINRRFFQIVQLERITNYARGVAYDSGVYRAFAIAKKKKLTGVLKKEAGDIGVDTNELKYLSKFKTAEDAYKDAKGKRILHIAGFKSTERDALIPTVGNRLLFAQSNNPAIRAVGQFLSWAQAKTTQTNALITRVEGGDVKQAVRILGALTIYGGVRELQVALSPSAYYDSKEYKEGQSLKKWIGEALVLSGNVPFQVDKIANAYAGPGSVSPLTSIVPVVSLMEKLAKLPTKAAKNIAADDYIGVASNVLDVTPFGREFKGYTFPILGIEDKPNREGLSPLEKALRVKGGRVGYAEGKAVFDPEGEGYDYTTAEKYGLGPDESGHYPSRVPETGQLLKGKKHPTFHLTQKEEKKLGNIIFKGKDGFYYSLSKDESKRLGYAEGYEVDVPYTKDEPEERINPFTGEPYTALYYRGGAVRKQYAEGGSAHISYLPEIIREDYFEARKEDPSIKGIDAWAEYRGISSEDLSMLRSEALSEQRSQMAMRNDPDARVGEIKKGYISYNPEYTTQTVTDNQLEKLGRLAPPSTIETYEHPIFKIPYIKEKLRMPIGQHRPEGDVIRFPVGEPEVQAHEYMHRGFGRAGTNIASRGLRGFIGKEIIQGPLGDQSTYSMFSPLITPTIAAEHLYIIEKTAPNFFTDKTDKLIKTKDKKEREEYIIRNFSKLFPEYKDEEKFAAYRKKIVEKIDKYIEDNPDKVYAKRVNEAYSSEEVPFETVITKDEEKDIPKIYNNPGNIEEGEGFAGETGEFYNINRRDEGMGAMVVFDSPEAGLRAMFREYKTKLDRYSDKGDKAIDYAVMEFLGGLPQELPDGTYEEDTYENRLKASKIDNEHAEGYIQRVKEAYNKGGLKEVIRRSIVEENEKFVQDYYLKDSSILDRAEKIAQYDYPTGTTTAQMIEDLDTGAYRTQQT